MKINRYIIIGGGPAGATAALEIRKIDSDGDIILISAENYQFYKRSKIINLISKSCSEDDLFLKGKKIYDENNIEFIHGQVEKVIPERDEILLKDGRIFHYNFLLIASGGHPILFPWKGVDLEGISTLYNLDDAKKVAEQACSAKNAVIVGGGAIAMKVIQNFKKIGLNTSIIEKASHLWPIGFDRKIARIVEKRIRENGIPIYLNEEIVEFQGKNNKLSTIILKSGRKIPADLAVITIGMNPNINFLAENDINIDKGVLVDNYMRTNIPNIFAAGDVAQIYDPLYESPILHPTWGNAKKQGKIAAINMTGGNIKYKGTIPIQSIKIFGFKAIAVGITHSKKNYDEVSLISFEREICRKFISKNDNLIGVLVLGKNIDKKVLKPVLKKAVFDRVNIQNYRDLLLENEIKIYS
ncbi:MAG: NAD(P)/FAD-dependent oxidoreductase [Candidatus Odinarchaeota archaeon]